MSRPWLKKVVLQSSTDSDEEKPPEEAPEEPKFLVTSPRRPWQRGVRLEDEKFEENLKKPEEIGEIRVEPESAEKLENSGGPGPSKDAPEAENALGTSEDTDNDRIPPKIRQKMRKLKKLKKKRKFARKIKNKKRKEKEKIEIEIGELPQLTKKNKKLAKLIKRTFADRSRTILKYTLKKIQLDRVKKVKDAVDARKRKRKEARLQRTNHYWVQQPARLITSDAPTRPFPENMCKNDTKANGSAQELINALFGYMDRGFDPANPWRQVQPNASIDFINAGKAYRMKKLRESAARSTPEDVRRRDLHRRQKKTLTCLQEIIQLMHFRRHDEQIQKAVKLMTKRSMFDSDAGGTLKMIRKGDYSMMWSDYDSDKEMLEILEQRRDGAMLRPVFIDGLSILTIFYPDLILTKPKIHVKILINFLMHFLLDGPKVCIFLPEFLKNCQVNDPPAFQFLITQQLIRFVNSSDPPIIEKAVRNVAEKTCGIFLTDSEDVKVENSVICRPVINRFSDEIDDFLIFTGFEKNFEDSESPEDVRPSESEESSDNDDFVDITPRQAFSRKLQCRLYSGEEVGRLAGGDKDYQLRIEQQVFLISSLCHLVNFHSRPFRLIKSFFAIINRYSPEIVPNFMQNTLIYDIADGLENIRQTENPEFWPIFTKYSCALTI